MRTLRLLAAFLALACALRAEIMQDPDKPDLTFRAHWIGSGKNPAPNSWTAYRRTFELPAAPIYATTRIAVDSKYWLWVNGTLVVFEGGLKRGPTPRDTYYDTVDIARWLHKGKNTVAVLTWFWGKNGFSHHDSGKAGLLFEMDTDLRTSPTANPATYATLDSGTDWKVDALPAYGVPAGETPNFRLAEGDIRFDARANVGDWQGADFDDSAWVNARDLGPAGCPPWNQLYLRTIPQWKDSGLQPYVNAAALPKISDGTPIVAKLPYNAQITPALKVDAPAGLVIGIRTGNYMDDGTPNVRAEYVTRAGVQSYESYGWMNGQEVVYTIPAGVKILDLSYRETGYNTNFTGAFSCDDPFLNTLWEKARRTLYVTMRDTYMDCPDRERGQWWGDAVIEMGESFYSLSPSSALLAGKAIRELCAWQRPDKTLYSPVPSGNWDQELPQQMLAAIGQYGFWTYYMNTGDRNVISAYPHVRDYLSLWKLDAQGLVVHRSGGWDWADWGDNIDDRVLDQAWYVLALQGAANLARLADRPAAEVDAFEKTRRTVIDATNRLLWNGEAYRSPGYKGDTDDRANALCVVAGIADAPRFPAIKKVLAHSYHASPYMEKYVLEALMLMDDPDAAVARMKKRYGDIVADSWTTLPELWHGGTHNHAWSGGPLTILSQYFAGLTPISPGWWNAYQVCPQMGPLREINAKVDTRLGQISVSIHRVGQGIDLTLVSPIGIGAIVCLPFDPVHPPKRVTANNRVVWPDGNASTSGPVFLNAVGDRLRFKVPYGPGTWAFHLEP